MGYPKALFLLNPKSREVVPLVDRLSDLNVQQFRRRLWRDKGVR